MEAQQHRPQGHAYEEVLVDKVGLTTALDDDPNAPKDEKASSNYQSKVTDPSGVNNEEAGTTPLVQSFEKMNVNEETKPEKGAGEVQEGKMSTKSTDRGVSKMKEYIAEKFKPRDEDKALSEVISGTLSGQKDKTVGSTAETGKALSDVISGKLSQQKDKTGGTEEKGTVKKPEEVATTQAGPATATHGEGAGKGMMDRVKGVAASLWLRKGGGKEAAQQTPSTPDGT
ncbi:low-temperature-induced 65 kDa protein-like [Lycium barbarum]|uniref:low-temperature-induced 65 kDa protein-like n=1 Tax=Lycium barbarum TaxID=112863 RepID=UPI00293E6CFD|nr:low-temperature-induced 65 kDa protein-like [Lycium barbarum]